MALGIAGADRQKAAEKLVQLSAERLVELSAGQRGLLESARDHFIARVHADPGDFGATKALQIVYAALPRLERMQADVVRTAGEDKATRKQRAQQLESILRLTTSALPGNGFPDWFRLLVCKLLAYGVLYATIVALILVAVSAPPVLVASATVNDGWYIDVWLDIGVSLILIAVFQLMLQRILLSGRPQRQNVLVALGLFPVGVLLLLLSRNSFEATSWLSEFLSELGTGLVVLTVVDTLVVGAATSVATMVE